MLHVFPSKNIGFRCNKYDTDTICACQTVQLMDLEVVKQACDNNNRDDADKILQRHFDIVQKMRRDKEETLAVHRHKVMQRLEHNNGPVSETLAVHRHKVMQRLEHNNGPVRNTTDW